MPPTPSPVPSAEALSELARMAAEVAHRAYAPYSNFFVGAAILLASGEIVTGCNVENASYRLTTCAEQNAIAAAVARFGPQIRIAAVVVANAAKTACQPCGACRQTIAEFAPADAVVLFPGSNGEPTTLTVAALLPAAFEFETK